MLIEEASGKTMAGIEAEEGRDAVVISEASVIEQLAVMLRCSIGTMGGGWGATARYAARPPSYPTPNSNRPTALPLYISFCRVGLCTACRALPDGM